jgi:predicted Zn-dependent protease
MTDSSTGDDDTADDREALYRALIAADPESALPRFSLARLCHEAGRDAEAAELLRFCVAKTSDWAAAWLLLGDALAATGASAEAKAAYERCRAASVAQHHSSLAEEAEEKANALA